MGKERKEWGRGIWVIVLGVDAPVRIDRCLQRIAVLSAVLAMQCFYSFVCLSFSGLSTYLQGIAPKYAINVSYPRHRNTKVTYTH